MQVVGGQRSIGALCSLSSVPSFYHLLTPNHFPFDFLTWFENISCAILLMTLPVIDLLGPYLYDYIFCGIEKGL